MATDRYAPTPARPGYLWYSVCTPQVFSEEELPENEEDMTDDELLLLDDLTDLAEAHHTHLTYSKYQLG